MLRRKRRRKLYPIYAAVVGGARQPDSTLIWVNIGFVIHGGVGE
jgi:hypothetical protein